MAALANTSRPRESKQAFRDLFDRHGGFVLGYCTRVIPDRSQAEDVAVEVWIRVIQSAEAFSSTDSIRPWILSITRNAALNSTRRRKQAWVETDSESFEESIAPEFRARVFQVADGEIERLDRLSLSSEVRRRSFFSFVTIEFFAALPVAGLAGFIAFRMLFRRTHDDNDLGTDDLEIVENLDFVQQLGTMEELLDEEIPVD
jgi:RNA polymerase sigma factor (sigma-70 family)